jgi:HD-like signal output (HDOD) protein
MDQALLNLIARSASIPAMPQVVTRFLELSAEKDFDVREITAVLATDPGISSELLRLSNSAMFGVVRQVTSLHQAITLLGMKNVRTLVLGRYLVEGLDQISAEFGDFDFSYYWRRSLTKAVLAARFAQHLIPARREEAFMATLLCDVGVVILLNALGPNYAPIAAEYAPLRAEDFAERERAALGFCHADVSALVLERWMLPPLIVEAVRQHHTDVAALPAGDEAATLARITCGAGALAKILCEMPERSAVLRGCSAAMAIVDLDVTALVTILKDIETAILELADLLQLYIVRSKIFNCIFQMVSSELAGSPPGCRLCVSETAPGCAGCPARAAGHDPAAVQTAGV